MLRSILRLSRPMLMLPALLIIFRLPVPTRLLNGDVRNCVQAIGQLPIESLNTSATILDVQSGSVTHTTHATLPPDNWPSPDGRFAAFWWTISDQEVGLYVASTTSRFTILVYTMPISDYVNARFIYNRYQGWKWSPDSSQLSFAAVSQNRFVVTVTDVKTMSTRILTLPQRPSPNYPAIYNYGWSADQTYLAVVVEGDGAKEFFVWPTDSYILISPRLPLVFRQSYTSEVEWSPVGHKLVLYFMDRATTSNRVGIWSPEKGIEASASWQVTREQYAVEWSPDGSQIRGEDFSGHGSTTTIFGISGSTLVPDHTEANETSFISWTRNAAIMRYWKSPTQGSLASTDQLKRINLSKGTDETFAVGIVDVQESPDLRRLAYIVQTQEADNGSTFAAYVADIDGANSVAFWRDTYAPNFKLGVFSRDDGYFGNIFWSRDGHFVGIVVNGPELFSTVIASRDGVVRKEIASAFVHWVSGDWFYYQESETTTQESLIFVNVITGQTFRLVNMSLDQHGLINYGFVFSPDHRLLLSSQDLKSFAITGVGNDEVHRWNTAPLNTAYQPAEYSGYRARNFPDWTDHIFAWSPDSSMVAYLEFANATDSDLVVVNRDGNELRRLRLKEFQGPLTWTQCS